MLMICLCAEQGEEKEIGEDGHQDLVEEVNSHSLIVVASFNHHKQAKLSPYHHHILL